MTAIDWTAMFAPSELLFAVVIRGSVVYLSLFILLRVVLKRQAGTVGITDLLVVVLIADAAQNAMAAEYTSIADGLALVATITFWSYALDWLGYRVPWFQHVVRPRPLPLIKNGQVLLHHLRRELITHDELLSMLRQQGVDDPRLVRAAFMEGDGQISVLRDDETEAEALRRRVS
jgi:uncharacterized membrane protein YcaP (DUF421 family)